MRSFLNLLIVALLGTTATTQAAHTRARLALAADVAPAGQTVFVGIELRMDPHWHTYWKNPGVSGMETKVTWELPPGIEAAEILWPLPNKLPPDEFLTYVYENETVLLVRLKLAPGLKPGAYPLKAKVSWLECEESCISANAEVQATLTVGNELKASEDSALIKQWEKKLPLAGVGVSASASWEKSADEKVRSLIIEWSSTNATSEADFFPDKSEDFEVQGATERLPADGGKIRIRKTVKKLEGDWPKQVSGVLVQKSGNERTGYEVTLTPPSEGVPSAAGRTTAATTPMRSEPLWKMLFFAFVGGLILNVMPCVLPVISLKILGFVSDAHNDPRHIRTLGLVYAAGVLVSFLALAAVVILIQVAGHHAAWGMQFNSPYFLVAMAVLLTLISLNLFGVFEVSLGGRTMDAAASLSSKSGKPGAFFNGLLATVLATSCTAPALGTAVGFAFTRPPIIIVLMMLTVGAGLAAPYVLLSCQPAWLKYLPKPGLWMEKFKIAMGFPMLAATAWVCSQLSTHYGDRAWDVVIFLLFVAGAAWIYGQFFQRGRKHRGFAAAAVASLLIVGYVYGLELQLKWRDPIKAGTQAPELSSVSPAGAEWKPWSTAAVTTAQAAGQPVVVDFTAKWCLTCQKNIKPVLGSQSVRSKMEQLNAVGLIGDYTRFPDDITEELNRYGRAGVPLVLVFPGKSGTSPIVLPEVLTSGMVVDALTKAGAR